MNVVEPGSSGPMNPSVKPKADHTDLMASLQALGLNGLTAAVVEKAVVECFPKGTSDHAKRTFFAQFSDF